MKQPAKEAWLPVRLGALVEYLRGSLWFGATVGVAIAGVLAVVIPDIRPSEGSLLDSLTFRGSVEGAAGILRAIATSVITVTTLVFTLTVLTLQLASQQFSPRLLRTFLREATNQAVLGVFLGTFVYALLMLREVYSGAGGGGDDVPGLAVTVALLLMFISVAALVTFIEHIAHSVRIDSLMKEVQKDTRSVIDDAYPGTCRPDGERDTPAFPDDPVVVASGRSGFVTAVAPQSLERLAHRHDVVLAVVPKVGERVVEGCPLVLAWAGREHGDRPDAALLAEDVNDAIDVTFERTMQHDVAYGLRQLVDVAVKALSPGVNDPTTAMHAIGHLASILCVLVGRDLSPLVRTDDHGVVRVFMAGHGLRDYLDLACRQIRLYGARDAVVAVDLLEMLRDVARCASRPEDRRAVQDQAEMVVAAAEREISEPYDMDTVRRAAAVIGRDVAGGDSGELRAELS